MACQLNIKLLLASVYNLTVLLISIILFSLFPGSDKPLIGIKNIIVTLQIRNKPFAQKLIRLISVLDLPKGTFTINFNILPFVCIDTLFIKLKNKTSATSHKVKQA